MTAIQLAIGLAIMLAGGEALVRGSVAAARRLGVSPLLIGLTLVGFGTSTPELVACLQAALVGAPGIAIGNVVGSNIANVLLILGLAAVITPLATTKEAFRRDGAVLIGASILMLVVVLFGVISRAIGSLFLLLLAAYVVYAYLSERQDGAAARVAAEEAELKAPKREMPLWVALLLALGGLAAVVLGAGLLVEAAIVLAQGLGLSEAVIGLTLVAVGTSLPELVTSLVAAVRRHADVAFGNIVGSNIFNVLGIAGLTATVRPIAVPSEIAGFDIWVMLAAALLLVLFAATGWRVNRWEGGAFLFAYLAYLVFLLSPAGQGILALA